MEEYKPGMTLKDALIDEEHILTPAKNPDTSHLYAVAPTENHLAKWLSESEENSFRRIKIYRDGFTYIGLSKIPSGNSGQYYDLESIVVGEYYDKKD